jgi:hypothetical protein
MERRYIGLMRAGQLLKIYGDAEEIRALADGAMGREIQQLRRRVAALETEVRILRERDAGYWRCLSRENHRAPRRMTRVAAWITTRWAVLTLGRAAIYGGDAS